jgi:DNA topoisomerase-1
MRTDSVNLADKAIKQIRALVEEKYGKKYIPPKPNYYKKKSKNAQEAHEAIRPTDFNTDASDIEKKHGKSAAKLYELIWKRAVSSQMRNKEIEALKVSLVPKDLNKPEYIFTLGGEKTLFEGFRKVLGTTKRDDDLQEIAQLKEGDELEKVEFVNEQKFTQPPARYTEASLIKQLEKLGIGRPSTYSSIISTIRSRGYVEFEARLILPTDIGRVVTNFLRDNFKRLVDYEYTAKVEDELDDIALGKKEYVPVIDEEYKSLMENIDKADKAVKKEDVVILGKSEEKCPKCGGEMVVRIGRYGKFLSCAKFPECKGMKDISGGEEKLDYDKYFKPKECPECKSKLVLKTGRYGKFWACETYPDCKGVVPLLLNEKCPECGHHLVERKSKWGKTFIGCSNYPNCKYIKKSKKKTKKKGKSKKESKPKEKS